MGRGKNDGGVLGGYGRERGVRLKVGGGVYMREREAWL